MRKQRPSPRRFLKHVGAFLAAATGLAAVYSCSLIVETRSQQCMQDSDCASFSGYGKCDTTSGLCVSTSTSTNSSSGSSSGSSGNVGCDLDGGIEGGGCYNGGTASCPAPSTNSELLNQCTTGSCYPFDDTSVHGLVNGALPSLPRPPDGGM
jgi:hypothetical protein